MYVPNLAFVKFSLNLKLAGSGHVLYDEKHVPEGVHVLKSFLCTKYLISARCSSIVLSMVGGDEGGGGSTCNSLYEAQSVQSYVKYQMNVNQ